MGDKTGVSIYNNAWGINGEAVEVERPMNKGYGNSTTLSEDVTDYDKACLVLLSLSETVGARMRENNIKSYCIAVETKDYEFKRRTHQTTLVNASNLTNIIYEVACDLLKNMWDGTPLRLLGIRASKLTEEGYDQLSLFEIQEDKNKKLEKLDFMLDSIRGKYGDNAVKRASLTKQKDQD